MFKHTFQTMRKVSIGLLLLALIATSYLPAAQAASTTPEVQNQTQATALINDGGEYLRSLITHGYIAFTEDLQQAADPINRAQAAVLLQQALQLKAPAALTGFPDVTEENAAAPAIYALHEQGIVQGGDSGYQPESALTREQLASLLSRAFQLNDNGIQAGFADGQAISAAHVSDALKLKQHFIWDGQSFAPQTVVTKGEFGHALYLALGLDVASSGAIPLEDFFRESDQQGFQLSPDGKHMAFVQPVNNRLNLFVMEVGKEEAVQLTHEADRGIQGFAWVSNDRLIYAKDTGGDENYHLLVVGIDGKGQRDLTPYKNTTSQLIDILPDVPDQVLIGMNKRDPRIFDVYRVNMNTGETVLAAENPGNITGWMTDNKGKLRIAISSDGNVSSLLYREKEEDSFKPLLETGLGETFSPLMFTFDNTHLYALSNLGSDKAAVVEFDPVANKVVKTVFAHPDVDVSGIVPSRATKTVVAAVYLTDKVHYTFFDTKLEEIYNKISKELPGKEIAIGTPDEKGNFRFQAYNDKNKGVDYTYNAETGELEKIAELSYWLDESKLADIKPVTFKSRDGLTIHGYLTLPKGKEAKDLPLVVNPHGGPWARDAWGYNPEVQFLANRGYAVLQVNFRGSTGYGKAFLDAGNKEWGKAMQNDLTDGVEWLVDQGIVDADRVAIYGASYGGYAALAGLTFTPEVYAAGISYVGPSNLFTLLESLPPYWESERELFHQRMGDPVKDKELLEAISPLFHVDQIKAPLFVAQGANDPRVKQAESDQIVQALKERGVDVPYMLKLDEGHGFYNTENQLDFYRALEKFLDRHLNP
ncbi:MAG: peptidase [Paenibacillaceae bacterium]|nr:peptidase [Paenibacillaceae bacterium]